MEQINTNEAAIILKCCQSHVRKLINDGLLEITSVEISRGRAFMVDKAQVEALAKQVVVDGKTSREQNLVDDLLSLTWPATAIDASARLGISTPAALNLLSRAFEKNLVTRHKHGKRLYFLMTPELLRYYVEKFCD